MRGKQSLLQKEWSKVVKQEQSYLQKRVEKKDSRMNQLLEKKVPGKLQAALNQTFLKAFYSMFEIGTDVIEKTYNRDELEKEYKINDYIAQLRENPKTLKSFSRKAARAGNVNLLLSGVSGVGLGLLGVGIPDIVLFTGLLLKCVYEIALDYGFEYESEEEKQFILLLIRGALSYGEELQEINKELNQYIQTGKYSSEIDIYDGVKAAAGCLSKELLYMKFLQGIPLVGAAGGAYDVVYMKQVVTYAELKYRRRFYVKRMNEQAKEDFA